MNAKEFGQHCVQNLVDLNELDDMQLQTVLSYVLTDRTFSNLHLANGKQKAAMAQKAGEAVLEAIAEQMRSMVDDGDGATTFEHYAALSHSLLMLVRQDNPDAYHHKFPDKTMEEATAAYVLELVESDLKNAFLHAFMDYWRERTINEHRMAQGERIEKHAFAPGNN